MPPSSSSSSRDVLSSIDDDVGGPRPNNKSPVDWRSSSSTIDRTTTTTRTTTSARRDNPAASSASSSSSSSSSSRENYVDGRYRHDRTEPSPALEPSAATHHRAGDHGPFGAEIDPVEIFLMAMFALTLTFAVYVASVILRLKCRASDESRRRRRGSTRRIGRRTADQLDSRGVMDMIERAETERTRVLAILESNSLKLTESNFRDGVPRSDSSVLSDDTSECQRTLVVPFQHSNHDDVEEPKERAVSRTCSICLSPYAVGDLVSWASNETCSHVFHEDCIATWLISSKSVSCPMCRQPFITKTLGTKK